jgi:hypothetical protein
MSITDRAAQVLQQIDARIAAIAGNWPDESRALRCLRAAIEGLMAAKEWNEQTGEEFTPRYAAESLAAICDQWSAGR